jgi:protein-S-isoprenylcysteine O-methyltransferase Ste14
MPRLAIALVLLYFVVAFGLRSVLHYRATGTTGFVGLSGRACSLEWLGGVLFGLALAGAAAAPFAQLAGWLQPFATMDRPAVHAAGLALFVAGLLGTFWAQLVMGESWRIGVDSGSRTDLVLGGPFQSVRNPIFAFMLLAIVGLALLVPNLLSGLAAGTLFAALELQVRFVEEPHLTRVHGERYLRYARRAGRFVPGLGCLP